MAPSPAFASGSGVRPAALIGNIVPPPPRLAAVMRSALSAGADSEARRAFSVLWQDRVKHILIDKSDDPGLIVRLEMSAEAGPAPAADIA